MKVSKALVMLGILALGAPMASEASSITFSSGVVGTRAAEVTFDDLGGGGTLQVTLSNVSTYDVLVPTDLLTAVFFDLSATLTKVSAVLAPGSSVIYDTQPVGGVVGGEWAYKAGLATTGAVSTATLGGGTKGISSTGLDLFGPGDRFNTVPSANLAGPESPDGPQYGIVSPVDNPLTGNGGVRNSGGLIKSSVVFRFSYGGTIDLSTLSKVEFLYGTGLTEPSIPGQADSVPDGGTTLSLLGSALLGLGLLRRKFNV